MQLPCLVYPYKLFYDGADNTYRKNSTEQRQKVGEDIAKSVVKFYYLRGVHDYLPILIEQGTADFESMASTLTANFFAELTKEISPV